MTSDLMTPSSSTTAAERPARSAGSLLLPIAGGALIAGSLLYAAGLATSPPQASMAPADYIESLARDEGQTALSALLLHYGNIAMGLAWLAAPALVRGRRGRIGTVVGALMAALGLVTVAGNVLFDFWTGAIGRELDAGTALALFETVAGLARGRDRRHGDPVRAARPARRPRRAGAGRGHQLVAARPGGRRLRRLGGADLRAAALRRLRPGRRRPAGRWSACG